MQLIKIEPKLKKYSVYEGRTQQAVFVSDYLLTASEVEELRQDLWDGNDPDEDLVA
jgi:hypothetical protein